MLVCLPRVCAAIEHDEAHLWAAMIASKHDNIMSSHDFEGSRIPHSTAFFLKDLGDKLMPLIPRSE
jgi:hypothetical protein